MATNTDEHSLSPLDGEQIVQENPSGRDVETSSDDEFSDAREALASPTKPVTRVEKVDTVPAHGEVPGTEAYEKRSEDAKPDQIAVQPEVSSCTEDNLSQSEATHSGSATPVPKTVVTRVDSIPAHGEVPGTKAAELRLADAEPDVVEKASSKYPVRRADAQTVQPRVSSSIAADGGFGPMAVTEFIENEDGDEEVEDVSPEEETANPTASNDETADDFDDFTEGESADDFGDFGDNFELEKFESSTPPQLPISLSELPFPALNFTSPPLSLSELEQALTSHLSVLFPSAEATPAASITQQLPGSSSVFLSDRSHSLWQQLVSPPPLQPPNWVRSRIRRLFLVSLGVPVDLDEILPKSKQKKLILPYDPAEPISKASSKGKESKGSTHSKDTALKRDRGPPPPPDFDIEEVQKLCRKTEIDIEEMNDAELQKYVDKLEHFSEVGKAVLQYWIKRKEVAVEEKEAFDSVVESLVRHARRVRQ